MSDNYMPKRSELLRRAKAQRITVPRGMPDVEIWNLLMEAARRKHEALRAPVKP